MRDLTDTAPTSRQIASAGSKRRVAAIASEFLPVAIECSSRGASSVDRAENATAGPTVEIRDNAAMREFRAPALTGDDSWRVFGLGSLLSAPTPAIMNGVVGVVRPRGDGGWYFEESK